jgi:alcohol dehydrogenase (cytochrome c)
VIQGRTCHPFGGPEACFISAHDVETGEELWRTFLIPRPGEQGDETWAGIPYESRWHVGAWGTASYDPELNLIIMGTSVPAPIFEITRGTGDGDVLYSNSTLALDADTGEIVWYFQHLPRENWDLDHPFERILLDTEIAPNPDEVRWINPNVEPGEQRRVMTGIPGKTGIVWTIDLATGEFLWARETTYQNVTSDIDVETGRVTINEDTIVTAVGEPKLVCPDALGGKDWMPGAYSPLTGAIYMPLGHACMEIEAYDTEPVAEEGYMWTRTVVPSPDAEATGAAGRIIAISASTGETLWVHEQEATPQYPLLATGGGLLFGGDAARRFHAYDQETGEILWSTILSGPAEGHPVSFSVNGRQYIAVPAGGRVWNNALAAILTPDLSAHRVSPILYVFALPESE